MTDGSRLWTRFFAHCEDSVSSPFLLTPMSITTAQSFLLSYVVWTISSTMCLAAINSTGDFMWIQSTAPFLPVTILSQPASNSLFLDQTFNRGFAISSWISSENPVACFAMVVEFSLFTGHLVMWMFSSTGSDQAVGGYFDPDTHHLFILSQSSGYNSNSWNPILISGIYNLPNAFFHDNSDFSILTIDTSGEVLIPIDFAFRGGPGFDTPSCILYNNDDDSLVFAGFTNQPWTLPAPPYPSFLSVGLAFNDTCNAHTQGWYCLQSETIKNAALATCNDHECDAPVPCPAQSYCPGDGFLYSCNVSCVGTVPYTIVCGSCENNNNNNNDTHNNINIIIIVIVIGFLFLVATIIFAFIYYRRARSPPQPLLLSQQT